MLGEKKDPWDAAEFVLNKMPYGHKQFQSILWEVIRDKCHYPTEKSPKSRKYKLINGKFLSQNATLNAIVTFCGGISALVEEKKKRPGGCYFLCQPNRRVRAVLTTNYDPFLESVRHFKVQRGTAKACRSLWIRCRHSPSNTGLSHSWICASSTAGHQQTRTAAFCTPVSFRPLQLHESLEKNKRLRSNNASPDSLPAWLFCAICRILVFRRRS